MFHKRFVWFKDLEIGFGADLLITISNSHIHQISCLVHGFSPKLKSDFLSENHTKSMDLVLFYILIIREERDNIFFF